MKTLLKITTVLMLFIAVKGNAQTAAVAKITTFNTYVSSSTASEMARLEMIRLEQYNVLDFFDMQEVPNALQYDSCYGQTCLIEYGRALKVDFLLSGSIDVLRNKIVINLKLVDVKKGEIAKTRSGEFDNQEGEIQRMLGILIQEMHDVAPDPVLAKSLSFKNEVITSNDIGKVKNSGPRMGVAVAVGSVDEFLTRSENYGGLDMAPVLTNIGYQLEKEYVGTENFKALGEVLFNIAGLEQGKFVPSISLLNGFRFGKQNWEFAFGPTFGISKKSFGFFDTEDKFGEGNHYWSLDEFNASSFSENTLGSYGYAPKLTLDDRGDVYFSTRWLMAFGRTFQSGSLNIPVNVYFSSTKKGGLVGLSVGFNIMRETKSINK